MFVIKYFNMYCFTIILENNLCIMIKNPIFHPLKWHKLNFRSTYITCSLVSGKMEQKINLTPHTEMFCFFDIHECTSSHVQPLDVIFGKIQNLPRAPSTSRSLDFFGHVVTRDQKTRGTCPLLCYFLSCPSNVLLDVFRKGTVPYEICTLSMHFL